MSETNTIKEINIFEDLNNIKDMKEKEIKIRRKKGDYALPFACDEEEAAPTNMKGQWKIISGTPGCGKTRMLLKYYQMLTKTFGKGTVAVMAIGVHQIEIEKDWGEICPKDDLYAIASDDDMPENLVQKLKDMVEKICQNNKYKSVIIDSLSGIYNIIAAYDYLQYSGLGVGGLNLKAPDFINVFIIKPLRRRLYGEKDENTGCYNITKYSEDRIIISSLLYGNESRYMKVLFEKFKSLSDSVIVLSEELARERIFPAIDRKRSASRRLEDFCSQEYIDFLNYYQNFDILKMRKAMNRT